MPLSDGRYLATPLTRGPWDLRHQHAGPPIALALGAIERAVAEQGMTHIARLTANLFRPVPIAELSIEVSVDYAGRNAAHLSARLCGEGKEVARFTALAQRESSNRYRQVYPATHCRTRRARPRTRRPRASPLSIGTLATSISSKLALPPVSSSMGPAPSGSASTTRLSRVRHPAFTSA